MKIFTEEIYMNVTEIIKDAFLFPSKNIGRFAIYLLLSWFMAWFVFMGVFTYASGLINAGNYLTGGMCLIISMLIGFIIAGYHIKLIKSGIELDDEVPVFELYENFMTGFDNVMVSILYFIIPVLIVLLVGLSTNVLGNAMAIVKEFVLLIFNEYIMGGSLDIAANTISHATSIAITSTVALILFVIFSFLQSMAKTRLANTGSVREALNIFEAAKDITRIGVGKVILVILLLVVAIPIIEIILIVILKGFLFLLPLINIIIIPYLALTFQRALGLLYSDIA